MYNVIFPRKKVGVILLFSIFICFFIGWINPSIVTELSHYNFVNYLFSPINESLSDFIKFNLANCVGGMIIPFGFLVALILLLMQSLFLGANLIGWTLHGIITVIYFSYIFILTIDSGFFFTLYALKRNKQKLKSEISLIIDRTFNLIIIITIFNLIWWFGF